MARKKPKAKATSKPMTLYGVMLSPYVARVALAAGAKGIKYDLTMPKEGLKSPEFKALSPFGKIPCIQDGPTVLFESTVILEYLDAKYKKKKLVPAAAKAAGQARLVGAVAAEYVQDAGMKLYRLKRHKLEDPGQAKALAAQAELAKNLDVLEQVLSGRKFASGGSFSIADCFAVPALFFATAGCELNGLPDPIGERPKLKSYWAAMRKNKLSKSVLDGMGDYLKKVMAA